jgi:hypothetical protein
MRTSIVGAAFLLVGAGAATVAAVDTNGNNLALNGSDTLFDVTQAVLTSCTTQFTDFSTNAISYLGGGSGAGSGQMDLGLQEVSPMSRALKSTEYCSIATVAGVSTPPSPGLSEGLLVGIDGVAIVANKTNTCVGSTAINVGITTPVAVTDTGLAGGPAPSSCPGCTGSSYTFADSFDALKVLYFGLTHDTPATYNCASPVRKTLIRQWTNFFSSDCAAGDGTCSGGITHAWRRSDLSGTTDAFYNILGGQAGLPGGKGVGTFSTVPNSSKKSIPFCNSVDAQTSGVVGSVTFPTSFGGSSDFSDNDPIRTNCNPLTTTTDASGNIVSGSGDEVCQAARTPAASFAGDLGVVLPVFLPDSSFTSVTDYYPKKPCGTACTLVAPVKSNLTNGFVCPDSGGSTILGGCYMPFAGTADNPDPRCVAAATTRCFDVGSKRNDGRSYNLVTVVAIGQIPTANRASASSFGYQFDIDANKRVLSGSFYRIHSVSAGPHNVPDPTVGTTGFCNENDDTSQIGCLVDSDPCSVGYAGRLASRFFPGNATGTPGNTSVADNLKALSVLGVPPFTPGADPDLGLKNLLQPAGTTPLYPFSRRLYFATIYGFGKLSNGERELSQCYANNTIVNAAMVNRFVAVPGGVQCLDYPEESASTATPAPNAQGLGNLPLGGCGLGLTAHNACTDPATAPAICGDGVVATGFGEQCDPPNGTTCDTNCQTIP